VAGDAVIIAAGRLAAGRRLDSMCGGIMRSRGRWHARIDMRRARMEEQLERRAKRARCQAHDGDETARADTEDPQH
jgi:hypothetical protein